MADPFNDYYARMRLDEYSTSIMANAARAVVDSNNQNNHDDNSGNHIIDTASAAAAAQQYCVPALELESEASQQQQQPAAAKFITLSVEPCTLSAIKGHIIVLETELDEFNKLVTAKQAEINNAKGRLAYLKTRSHLNKCYVEGCDNFRQAQGVCKAHGASVNKTRALCSVEGCTKRLARISDGVCVEHGMYYILVHSLALRVL